MPFETNFGALTANLSTEVTDDNGLVPDKTIIRMKDTWYLHVRWNLSGMLVGMLAGNWHVQAYLESFGPQNEPVIVDDKTVTIASGFSGDPFSLSYDQPYKITNLPLEAGAYRLVTVITSLTPAGTPGPFAGYDEGPMLQFYEAPAP